MTRPADFVVAQVVEEHPGRPEAHTLPLLDQKNGDWDEPLLGSGNGGESLLGWKNGNWVDDCAAAVVLFFLHSLH